MVFTDPIIAGEELTRKALKSDNYIAGVSGWRIASDGAAEFDNIGVRGNLWVPSITLNGQDLNTRINNLPKGCIAYVVGYPTVNTTSETIVMSVEADIVYGRYYEIFCTNLTTDIQTGTDSAEFKFRWTLGNPPATVTTSSDVLALGLRQSIFQIAVLRYAFWSGATTRARIAVTLASLNGSNVRTWAPGAGATLAVLDHGVAPYDHPGQGSIGSGGGPRTLKEWTITANASKSYTGVAPHPARTDGFATTLVAGDWQNGLGNQRAWFTFSNSDISTKLNDLVGVPLADIVTAEVKLAPFQYKTLTDDGRLSIGFHNTANSLPNNEPGGGVPNVHRPYVIGSGPMWIGLLGGSVPTNFLDSMRDGYLKGFMVGNTFAGDGYCIVCEGTGGWTNYPQLHMKYWK
jgi:hypothetical protein